jgi:hypothetical protein
MIFLLPVDEIRAKKEALLSQSLNNYKPKKYERQT